MAGAPEVPRRLAHCVVRTGTSRSTYSGVSIEWFAGREAAAAYDEYVATCVAEPEALPCQSALSLFVEERPVNGENWLARRWSDGVASPAPVLIGCIEPVIGLGRPEFRDYWWAKHRPLANQLVPPELGPVAYVHDYVLPEEPGPWAGIGELYERSLDTARDRGAWFQGEAAKPLIDDEDRFLIRTSRKVLVADHLIIKAG